MHDAACKQYRNAECEQQCKDGAAEDRIFKIADRPNSFAPPDKTAIGIQLYQSIETLHDFRVESVKVKIRVARAPLLLPVLHERANPGRNRAFVFRTLAVLGDIEIAKEGRCEITNILVDFG